MITRLWAAALVCLIASAALADPPPSTAPAYRPGVSLQPIAIYDAAGNVISSFGGGSGGGASTVLGTQEQDVTESRTLAAGTVGAQQTYTLNGQSTVSFNFTGLAASGATVSFFQSNDWNGTTGTFTGISEVNTGTGIASLTRTADGQSAIGVEGTKAIRFQVTTAGTGTITLATNISVRGRYTALRSPVNQGAPGASPWPFALFQGGAANASGNPIFANIVNLPSVQAISATVLPLPTGAATETGIQQVKTTLGSPFQAGGLIGNAAFGISGPLPAFAAIPAFKIDQTTPGLTNAVSNFGLNTAGTQQAVGLDARGAFIAPNAGTANRQITKCSIAATSATLTCTINNGTAVSSPAGVCPAVANPVTTEIRTSVAAVGLGLNGQTLTTATDGTGAGSPDMPLPTANSLYTLPVGATNAVTAFNPSASAAITVCIQTLRQ